MDGVIRHPIRPMDELQTEKRDMDERRNNGWKDGEVECLGSVVSHLRRPIFEIPPLSLSLLRPPHAAVLSSSRTHSPKSRYTTLFTWLCTSRSLFSFLVRCLILGGFLCLAIAPEVSVSFLWRVLIWAHLVYVAIYFSLRSLFVWFF